MPNCPNCGANVPDGAVYCGNCGAPINASASSMSTASKTQTYSQGAPNWPNTASSGDVSMRLEKAMRRAELLGYAAAGLAVLILALAIVFLL